MKRSSRGKKSDEVDFLTLPGDKWFRVFILSRGGKCWVRLLKL